MLKKYEKIALREFMVEVGSTNNDDSFLMYFKYENININDDHKESLIRCLGYLNEYDQLGKFDINVKKHALKMKIARRAPFDYTLNILKLHDYTNTSFLFACRLIASVTDDTNNKQDIYYDIKRALQSITNN